MQKVLAKRLRFAYTLGMETLTNKEKTELETLNQKFQTLAIEKGLNKNYIFPDNKNVEKVLSNHPDFERWVALYGFAVMSASLRFGSY
jgi:hypothetical protein